jgi:hypothetical protein
MTTITFFYGSYRYAIMGGSRGAIERQLIVEAIFVKGHYVEILGSSRVGGIVYQGKLAF